MSPLVRRTICLWGVCVANSVDDYLKFNFNTFVAIVQPFLRFLPFVTDVLVLETVGLLSKWACRRFCACNLRQFVGR